MEFRKKLFEKIANRFRKVKTSTRLNHKFYSIKVEDLFKQYKKDLKKEKILVSALDKVAVNLSSLLLSLYQEDRHNLYVKDKFSYISLKNKSVITISDLHLTNFHNEKIWNFLERTINENEVEIVVINGDYFDGSLEPEKILNIDKFTNIVDRIRKFSSVVILPGNHDSSRVYLPRVNRIDYKKPFFRIPHLRVLSNYFSKYLLLEILNENGLKVPIWFEHGHRLNTDKFGNKSYEFSNLNVVAYRIEKFLHKRFGDKALKFIPGILKINLRNLEWAKSNFHDLIFSIGHSHYAEIHKAKDNLFFVNSGSLKQDNNIGSLILFKPNGDIKLVRYDNTNGKEEIIKEVNFFQ